MGDFNGIGPEVSLKSSVHPSIQKICTPVLVGSIQVFEWYARKLRMNIVLRETEAPPSRTSPSIVHILPVRKFESPVIRPGTIERTAGTYAGETIEIAARLCSRQMVDGIVTGPASKQSMNLAGYSFPGQTELLATLSGRKNFAMMLVAGSLRVGLVTIHLPLKKVSQAISKHVIVNKLSIFQSTLQEDFAIRSPKIAVMGLNPHAGEHGVLGGEELKSIIPALLQARKKGLKVEGPFPADGFWGTHQYKKFDAILAMYHDQGLIPLKMTGFDIGVNVTCGLPIIRTSPDHGTAFDIAGKGVANTTSMKEAIHLAVRIVKNRRAFSRR